MTCRGKEKKLMKYIWLGCSLGLMLIANRLTAAEDDWRPESTYGRRSHDVPRSIARAEAAEEGGNFKRAIKHYRAVERHSVNLRNRGRAVVAQGRCLERLDKPVAAYKRYRQALDEYGGFVPFREVVEAEFGIANQFFEGRPGSFLGISMSNDDLAIDIYDHLVRVAPYARIAPKALYRSGLLSLRLGHTDEAIDKFRRVQSEYRSSPVAQEAQVALADALLNAAQEGDGDGLLAREARRQLDRFLSGERDAEAQQEAAALRARAAEIEAGRLLDLARFYEQPGDHFRPEAARRYLEQAVARYPETDSARQAEQRLAALAAEKRTDETTPSDDGDASAQPTGTADSAPSKPTAEPIAKPAGASRDKWLLPVEDLGVIGNEKQ
jgi:tetratricopeptide (TPR) repeat protein